MTIYIENICNILAIIGSEWQHRHLGKKKLCQSKYFILFIKTLKHHKKLYTLKM